MYVYYIYIYVCIYVYTYIYMYIYSESPTEKYCFTHDGQKNVGKKRQVCTRPKANDMLDRTR